MRRPTRTVALFCRTISIKRVIRRDDDDSSFGGVFTATSPDERALTINASCRHESAFMTSLERPGDDATGNWPHGSSIPQPPMPPFRLRASALLLLCRSVWPATDPIFHQTTKSAANICLLRNILHVLFYVASISALGLRRPNCKDPTNEEDAKVPRCQMPIKKKRKDIHLRVSFVRQLRTYGTYLLSLSASGGALAFWLLLILP